MTGFNDVLPESDIEGEYEGEMMVKIEIFPKFFLVDFLIVLFTLKK